MNPYKQIREIIHNLNTLIRTYPEQLHKQHSRAME